MPHSLRSITLLAALSSAVLAHGQQPMLHDTLLDHFLGHWVLEGTIAKKQTTHDVDAEWVIGHQYLRIHEVSREHNAQGEPVYEATVHIGWNQDSAEYGCIWLDTYGGLAALSVGKAKRNGDQIAFLFQDKDDIFHTMFVYHAVGDSWEWNLDSEAEGKLRPFARVTLTRVK
jgi:hypothetical protein